MNNKKPPEVKPATAKSAYNGITNYTVDTGFGAANAALDGTNLVVKNTLTSPIRDAVNNAQSGIARGANYFSQDPLIRVNDAVNGLNPYANIFKQNTDRIFKNGLEDANAFYSRRGLGNSTVMGGAVGQLINDRALTDNQNILAAIDAQNALEQQALAANQGIYGGISDITGVPLGMASGNLQTGFGSQDQIAMMNAQQIQQAAQARAQRGSLFGNLIGAGMTGLGYLAGGPFGGAAGRSAGLAMGRMF